MSEHVVKIVGTDEKTNSPVHIALTLVLGEREAEAPTSMIEAFAAPRGFLPSYATPSPTSGETRSFDSGLQGRPAGR